MLPRTVSLPGTILAPSHHLIHDLACFALFPKGGKSGSVTVTCGN